MADVTLLQTIELPQFITQAIYAEDIDLLIISGFNGLISSFNTKTVTNIYKSGSYQLEIQSITDIFLSQDYQYIYVGAFLSGMFVLKINQAVDNINNLQDETIFILAGTGIMGDTAQSCLQTRDFYVYCYDLWTGLYFANAQQLAQSNQNEFPITFTFTYYWPQVQPIPSIQALITNSAETILFCAVRSFGIYLFDIRQRDKLQLIQLISSNSIPFSIQLSRNELYLYMSNNQNIYSFNQVQVNLNDDFPNLFNIHQSNFKEIPFNYKQRCYTDLSDSYLFGAFDYDGIYVFPIYRNPYRLNITNFQVYPFYTDELLFDLQGKYIIFPQYFKGPVLSIYQYYPLDNSLQQKDISPMNMKLIKNYYYNTSDYTPNMAFSVDRTLAIQSFQSFLILYNTTDVLDFQILSTWQKPNYLLGDLYNSIIAQNNKWIFGISLQYGYFLLDIQNKTNPYLANYSITHSGFSLVASKYYNLAYIAECTQGFSILDTAAFPQFKYMSRLNIPGCTFMVLPIQKDEYILVTQNDKGVLTLIDIRNKYNPVIINQIYYQNQYSQAVCSCNTMKYIFITISNGILTMPFFSEVKIHTDVFLMKHFLNTQQPQKQKYSRQNFTQSDNNSNIFNEYIFQVGQNIVLDFIILYPINLGMKVSNVYFYQNGNIVNIPQYFTFDQQQQSLQMQINSQLIDNNQAISNLKIILIKSYTPLDATSFIYFAEDSADLGITNSTQSFLIYQYLINLNIINFDGIINENYNVQSAFNFDQKLQSQLFDQKIIQNSSYEAILQQITQKVSLTIKKSYSYNPFKYYVISSLKFDNSNRFQFISTNSLQSIQVILQINSEIGKLIHKNQDSVNFQISESQDQLQIIGTLQNVNKVLSQQIIFANSSSVNQNSLSAIQITINDNINYPLTNSIRIFECNFIKLKNQIQVNKKFNLQKQIENQFKEGIIDIESDIVIQFSSKSFYIGDTQKITYQTYVQNSDGEFVLIPPSLWLQQQSNDKLNFKGTTTSSIYRNYYKFKVKATDGYTTAADYFVVQVSGIPFTYAINLLIKILGPLLGILGLYQQRHFFYNIIFQKQVTFSNEEVECGQEYQKKLIIIGKQNEDAIFIVRTLFKNVMQKPQQRLSKGEVELPCHRASVDQQENMDNLSEEQNKKNQQDEIKFKDFEKLEQKNGFNIFLKKANNQQYKKLLSNFLKIKSKGEKSSLEKRYLNKSGSLVLSQAIQDIINFKIKPSTYQKQSNEQYLNELQDVNSVLQRAIRAQISRNLLKHDQKSQIIYELIKNYCFQNINQNKNDWYKAIIKIQYKSKRNSQQNNNYSSFDTFPSLDFKYDQLLFIFQQILNIEKSEITKIPHSFNSFKKYINVYFKDINLYLFREVIFADVLGFPQKKPSGFQPSVGQSIHINSYNFSQIIAFKKREICSYLRPIYQFLNMEYSKYGFSKNMRLPAWLQFDQKNGFIILHGIPQQQDIEEILIKIYDTNKYVIQQFIIKIKFSMQSDKQQQQIDEIYTDLEESKQLITQTKYQPIQKIKKPMILQQNSQSKYQFLKNFSDSLSPSSQNQSSFQNELKINKSVIQNLNSIQKTYPDQDDIIQGSIESNIGEELSKSETIAFSVFTTHRNSISEKQEQQFLNFQQIFQTDEINENL
ncbi:calpain family cysteine protease (macronuclear) [Tetrahymena thermophila SB210]|uniref:Calpain family cysteine protease n=1 Tax=Tetrahymena thermophila (strain SB210) TaxID=312017 RepID=A4VEU5_TETTS|nr:calpain family cysteine protease [Tetrahymena thermophila SB210]EDK32041.2 calpain family cysteine protease [Tetrahymena thermophila SB210]|eukprot:XP_001470713.2 calpain family cysteine protease [Tetrahymena thermophila SB210]